jgi:hypothetical protein
MSIEAEKLLRPYSFQYWGDEKNEAPATRMRNNLTAPQSNKKTTASATV